MRLPEQRFRLLSFNHPEPLTEGIYTTDRTGKDGYNADGDYTADFGGTSSSCPGVAGTVALILAANPELTWDQVREIIKETSEKIDRSGGKYDSKGHSKYYGYGRVNAEKAVKKAVGMKSKSPVRKSKAKITA